MRVLILGPDETKLIQDLIAKAAAEPASWATVQKLAGARASRPDLTINPLYDDYTIGLPGGFRVTYTHEHQKQCLCRHLSVSVDNARPGAGPHPAAVQAIMDAFGFNHKIGSLPSWISHDPGGRMIVEVIEPVEGSVDQLRKS